MRIEELKIFRIVCLTIAVTLLCSESAFGQVINGDFEGPTTAPWTLAYHENPPGCFPPFRAAPFNLPYPPGPQPDEFHLLWIGQVPAVPPIPGCDPSGAYQWFDCETGGSYCTVSFQYQFDQIDLDDDAVFVLKSSGGLVYKVLPPSEVTSTVSVSVQGCGSGALVLFAAVDDHSDGIQSVLWIDNVQSQCTANDDTTPGLDDFTGDLGFDLDNLPEDPLPDRNLSAVPAVSEWGLVVMTLLVLAAGTLVFRRFRAAAA